MTDDYNDDQEPTEDSNIRNLRQKAKEADGLRTEVEQMRAQLAQAERERAFFTAGIDPADPKAKYFVKGYDGEITAEAIKAEAAAAGILAPPSPAVPQETFEAFDRIGQTAAGGAGQPGPTGADAELRPGMSPEEIGMILMKHGQPVGDTGPQSGFQPLVR